MYSNNFHIDFYQDKRVTILAIVFMTKGTYISGQIPLGKTSD